MMPAVRLRLLPALLLPCALFLRGATPAPMAAPIINFRFQTVTPENNLVLLLAGTARYVTQKPLLVEMTDATFTTFKGDAANHKDTELTTPAATALLDPENKQQILHGDSTVHLTRDDLEITGEQWTYDGISKTVTIEKNTRVVFRASLPGLLK